MNCPYCDSLIPNDTFICPHCKAILREEKVIKKDNYNMKYTIIGVLSIFLVILVGLNIWKFTKTEKIVDYVKPTTTTKELIAHPSSNNQGVYSGYEQPVDIGTMTFFDFYDKENDKTTAVDLLITRYLEPEEVIQIQNSKNQFAREGFYFTGVEFQIKFNDLTYLQNPIDPSELIISIRDDIVHNDFFHYDDHYYRTEAFIEYDGPKITNGESMTGKVIYQVPNDTNYFICFGSTEMGCYKNN